MSGIENQETAELRVFVDALRGALGLAPLYKQERRSVYFVEQELPLSSVAPVWFKAGEGVPEESSFTRDKSIEFAVRKLTQAPPVEQHGAHHAWTVQGLDGDKHIETRRRDINQFRGGSTRKTP